MYKKFVYVLTVAFLAVAVAGIFGCTTTTSSSTTKDPGRLASTPEVTTVLTPSYSGGTVTLSMGSIIVSGSVVTLTSDMMKIFIGTTPSDITSWDSVTYTISTTTSQPIDIVFVLDNTGSMASRIQTVKDSISAFAASLEADGVDARFAGVVFGDYSSTKSNMGSYSKEYESLDFDNTTSSEAVVSNVLPLVNAGQLDSWLDSITGYSGNDGAENPLDGVMDAYRNFSWRSTAQKIIIVVTDIYAHQVNATTPSANYPSGVTTYSPISSFSITDCINELRENATVHVISPLYTSTRTDGHADVRDLADGLGEGKTTAVTNTGGKWIVLPTSGDIDFNELGITTYITSGTLVTLSYSIASGSTVYVHVLIDYNLDGTYDTEWYGTLTASSASATGAGDGLVNPTSEN
ncbi:MAG: vWA domain-containing protein [Candidatus Margulisiibacteriota bacterium]